MTLIKKKELQIDEQIVILVCEDCGSTDIEQKAWVDANTNEFSGDAGDSRQERWCNDCQDHVDFCNQEDFIEEED